MILSRSDLIIRNASMVFIAIMFALGAYAFGALSGYWPPVPGSPAYNYQQFHKDPSVPLKDPSNQPAYQPDLPHNSRNV